MTDAILLTGTAAGPGIAAGPVRVIHGLDDFTRFHPGDVLVCRATSPAWTPLLARAAAVITETGGILAHAAIVAREFGIPAITAAREATVRLTDGHRVVVDGGTGTVSNAQDAT
ncbi:PEP-utilizing enzyme [Nocardia jiangsuensis]|uniref:PEP-utilizing enzyme n=1 Tax=Nocardia jiangsuensis TaxID=1691563 RepID=A0ABV8DPP0_9NOCA